MLRYLLLSAALYVAFNPLHAQNQKMDRSYQRIDVVEDLISTMTLEEKVGQMNQYTGFWDPTGPLPEGDEAIDKYEHLRSGLVGSMLNVIGAEETRSLQKIVVEESRLGIPLIFGYDVIHGLKTLSPIPLAEAASWDMEAIRKSAALAAREASAVGIHWTFAPMMDISRDARWGRVMEGAGEDPYLGSRVAAARVRGFQGEDLSAPNTIAACAKHFAAYGFAEAGRDYNTVDIGTVTLHNIALPPFKAAVDAGVATVMNGFNVLNGVPVTGDAYLQRDILKGRWGFDGFVVSDWASVGEMITHGFAADGADAAQKAVSAGCDMEMESRMFIRNLRQLVENGIVDEALLDDAVRRILTVKYNLGLFDDPYRYCDEQREANEVFAPAYREVVRDMARKSIVLLKNERNLLPLKQEGQRVAVIGPFIDDDSSPLGSWRKAADDHTAVTLKEGLMPYGNVEWIFEKGLDLLMEERVWTLETKINTTDRSSFPAAIDAAKSADVVLLAMGEHGFQSAEGRSRVNIELPGLQQELIEEILKVNQNVILLLHTGRPLDIVWASENVPAILLVWQLGTESGNAIADVVMGKYNPAGKLPMGFPRHVGQMPLYYNHYNTGRPVNTQNIEDFVFWSHYGDVENDALFPFGHGLSYTTFEYANLNVNASGDVIEIEVEVQNTGNVDGEEVIQLYIRDEVASVVRPVRELKAFDKVSIPAGESEVIQFSLPKASLGFYDGRGEYRFEPGFFQFMVGGSSDTALNTRLEVR